jgi:ribosomal protein S18 acetylase RimI-like enzyme
VADTTEDMSFDLLEGASLASWLARSRAEYVEERVRSGEGADDATANADASMERFFPGGSPAEGQLVGRLKVGGQPVGWLWVGPFGADPAQWWVWNVEITESERGRGYGRKAMRLAEDLASSRGAVTIGLNVFAHNRVARNLYTSLGYEETSVQMRKGLTPPR